MATAFVPWSAFFAASASALAIARLWRVHAIVNGGIASVAGLLVPSAARLSRELEALGIGLEPVAGCIFKLASTNTIENIFKFVFIF